MPIMNYQKWKFKKTITFMIALKGIKYLGINLTKDLKKNPVVGKL